MTSQDWTEMQVRELSKNCWGDEDTSLKLMPANWKQQHMGIDADDDTPSQVGKCLRVFFFFFYHFLPILFFSIWSFLKWLFQCFIFSLAPALRTFRAARWESPWGMTTRRRTSRTVQPTTSASICRSKAPELWAFNGPPQRHPPSLFIYFEETWINPTHQPIEPTSVTS